MCHQRLFPEVVSHYPHESRPGIVRGEWVKLTSQAGHLNTVGTGDLGHDAVGRDGGGQARHSN